MPTQQSRPLLEKLRRSEHLAFASLTVLHIAAFGVAILTLPYRWYGLAIGIGDAQLALSAIVLLVAPWRWPMRLPLAILLFCSGVALHYIVVVDLVYPFVIAEEYCIPILLGGVYFTVLRWSSSGYIAAMRSRTDKSTSSVKNVQASFHLVDLLIWTATCGLLITILRVAILRTDVSGMADPWETIEFALPTTPQFLFIRLPFTLAAIAAIACGFYIASIANARHWIVRIITLLAVATVCLILEFGIAVSFQKWAEIYADAPWPIFPVSTLLCSIAYDHFNGWELFCESAALVCARILVFNGSLVLIAARATTPRDKPALTWQLP